MTISIRNVLNEDSDPGMQGVTEDIQGFLKKNIRVLANRTRYGLDSMAHDVQDVVSIGRSMESDLKAFSPAAFNGTILYKPVTFSGFILDYSRVLLSAITELSDVNERLIQPLTTYFKHAVTTTTEQLRVWDPKGMSYANVRDIRKDMAPYFKRKANSPKSAVKAEEIYDSQFELIEAGKVIDEINVVMAEVNVKKLAEYDATLGKAVVAYVAAAKGDDRIVSENKATTTMLATTMLTLAKEIEMLAVVHHNITALNSAFSDSLDKLTEII